MAKKRPGDYSSFADPPVAVLPDAVTDPPEPPPADADAPADTPTDDLPIEPGPDDPKAVLLADALALFDRLLAGNLITPMAYQARDEVVRLRDRLRAASTDDWTSVTGS